MDALSLGSVNWPRRAASTAHSDLRTRACPPHNARRASIRRGPGMAAPIPVRFLAGDRGEWRIDRISPVAGPGLPDAPALSRVEGERPPAAGARWHLDGVTSNERYVSRDEKDRLAARSPPLGRPEATRAVLIPVRKSSAWWELPQDERRALLEERSRHIAIGLEYLPAIARRLYHSRDLGGPFDFLTWFEFAPASESSFDALLERLRKSEEWGYVEREVEVRLSR